MQSLEYGKAQESIAHIEEHLRFFLVYHRNDQIANKCLMTLGCSKKMVEALAELDNELNKSKLLPAEASDAHGPFL
jgi:hypothetical protein